MPGGTTSLGALVYGLGAIGSLAVGTILGQVPGVPVPGVEMGALGLCTFMVIMQYRTTNSMGRVIDAQHREFVKVAKDNAVVIAENTAAMKACVDRQKREA